jgi:glycosyltransferase involved in cell wall biosynthesis
VAQTLATKPKICIATCYRQPDYLRAATLRQGLKDCRKFSEVIVVKNNHTNFLRYFEIFYKLWKVRFTKNPDFYLVTFRGYEILPLVLLLGLNKKVIYDELVNPVEWFVYEHKYLTGFLSPLGSSLRIVFRLMMKKCDVILADTKSHAEYSAKLMSLAPEKYYTIPVGADELMFKPNRLGVTLRHSRPTGETGVETPRRDVSDNFRIFYYSSMLPLHGIKYVLEATLLLEKYTDIEFHIVGGKSRLAETVKEYQTQGANIVYKKWVDYDKIPDLIHSSNICLGGPFGDTTQSQFVITGKTYQFLASGKPVIIGKNQESSIFKDKENVLIVDQANSKQLAETILWAHDNPDKLEKIAEQGRKLYEKEFSSGRVAEYLRNIV